MSETDKLVSAGQTRAIVDEIMKAPTSPNLRKPTPQEAQEIAVSYTHLTLPTKA